MKSTILTITTLDSTARVLTATLQQHLDSRVEALYSTYKRRSFSPAVYQRADLFVLDLLEWDGAGPRAAALPVARMLNTRGKRVLIFSAGAVADQVATPAYWDLASPDQIHERIATLLTQGHAADLNPIERVFARYCRPRIDRHASRS